MAPWADQLYACDGAWWNVHGDEVRANFQGECWTTIPEPDPNGMHKKMADKYGLSVVYGSSEPRGLQPNGRISYGGNSGHQALHFAVNQGATKVLLLGYDFGGNGHWFGQHQPPLGNGQAYNMWLEQIKYLANDLRDAGVTVINCSRSTSILNFQRATIDDV